jgi:hypothetical protein|tara:strand:- start:274 stop:453 length:180 start_codon:yes stop_codon:yes gene_type:complete
MVSSLLDILAMSRIIYTSRISTFWQRACLSWEEHLKDLAAKIEKSGHVQSGVAGHGEAV